MSPEGRIVGVLGGMGPDATVDFMRKVIRLTPAEVDQDHVHMIIDNNPRVPNRQNAILNGGPDPGPVLADMARRLERAGADFLVISCNTAYVFKDAVLAASKLPLLSIIDVTVAEVLKDKPASVGVLSTRGCLHAGVYQAALESAGIEPVLPTEEERDRFMTLATRIKGGYQGEKITHDMAALAAALGDRGAEAIIAGCTEIPLVLNARAVKLPLFSSTDILAAETVAIARGEKPLPMR